MAKKPFGPKGPRDAKNSDSQKFGRATKSPQESAAPKFGNASKGPKKQASGFDKFANPKVGGAKLKEQLKQEKKTAVKERRAAIEAHFEKKRQEKAAQYEQRSQQITDNPNQKIIFDNKKEEKKFGKKAFKKTDAPKDDFKKSDYAKSEELLARKSNQNSKFKDKKTQGKIAEEVPADKRPVKPFILKGKTEPNKQKKVYDQPKQKKDKTRPVKPSVPAPEKPIIKKEKLSDDEILNIKNVPNYKPQFTRPYTRKPLGETTAKPEEKKKPEEVKKKIPSEKPTESQRGEMPLNKFIAHAGVCARRDAADLVRSGKITVDGKVVTEPGFKVNDRADVEFEGKKLKRSRNLVYILLNKPKDYITTAEDPQGRKTVMDIIKNATPERVYPIGRLDRNTSGVLVLTNDGDLAQQLSHPSFGVRKMYEVKLDKPVEKADFDKILKGITLEDGEIFADSLAYADSKDKSVIGIEIHSGRNRIVRRIFEHLGYDVRSLDRVMYANLTKKNVERGKWRFLSDKEVRLLKYFKSGK